MKFVTRRTWSTEKTATCLAVVFLFVLQIVSVGFATGAMAGGSGPLGAACATVKASPTKSDPSSPVSHHLDVCCVLHSSSAIGPDAQRSAPRIFFKEAPPVLRAPAFKIDAVSADPELRPLSPRAPPARSV